MKTAHFFLSLLACISLMIIGCSKEEISLENGTNEYTSQNSSNVYPAIDNEEEHDGDYHSGSGGTTGVSSTDSSGTTNDSTSTNCHYVDTTLVYYKYFHPFIKIKTLYFAKITRQEKLSNVKFNDENQNGCKEYIIPTNPIFIYDASRKQYYEVWKTLSESGKPSPNKHEIEL